MRLDLGIPAVNWLVPLLGRGLYFLSFFDERGIQNG